MTHEDKVREAYIHALMQAGSEKELRRLAEQGDAEMQYALAVDYIINYDNLSAAEPWLRKAAAQGHPLALYSINDGLREYHPENLQIAKQLRDNAERQLGVDEKEVEMQENVSDGQQQEIEYVTNLVRTFCESDLRIWQEQIRQIENKSDSWESQGLCRHCGGKLGVFKKCKVCKKSTNDRLQLPSAPNFTVSMGGHEWRVLCTQNNRALLLSEKVIEKRPYNNKDFGFTWANCALRTYLNGAFYNRLGAFKTVIAETKHVTEHKGTRGQGKITTTDMVFVFSLDEVYNYSRGFDRIATDSTGRASSWWLRSPTEYVFQVDANGKNDGYFCGHHIFATIDSGVRPALWLILE